VHWKLTGKKVLGIDDASGMFPIFGVDYDRSMLDKFNNLLSEKGINFDFYSVLPSVLVAGDDAGYLTENGAKLLDETGTLKAGARMCPPEGDGGTGMVATNAVKPRTGNVSAGTSAFVMAVMEKPLEKVYREIDVVTTPSGHPVAMVHVNNFTSEINAWAGVFDEVVKLCGGSITKGELFDRLFKKSAESDNIIGGLVGYNFLSGEPIVGVNEGRPLFARLPDGKFNLANFMQMQIYSALGALHLGMKILEEENVKMDAVCGHGGFFKTEPIGANAMSAALNSPITVMEAAGEGGAYGIALLALYAVVKKGSLEEFLDEIFASSAKKTFVANDTEKEKFANFMKLYEKGLFLAQKAGVTI
jgi:sugar (pentulose or hexulose) kinase